MSDSREWTAARDEYTYQLVQEIMPRILEIFEDIYEKCRDEAGEEKEEYSLAIFQEALQKIPHWNNISVERECKKIISGYPSLMDHVAAVFVSNIQILSCVRLDSEGKKDIHIKIPSRDTFIHKTLIQCAENIFQDPMMFWHKISYGEERENKKKKQEVVSESIQEAIRDMLPIQEILKEYLSETGNSGDNKATKDKKDDDDDAASLASQESPEPDSDDDSAPGPSSGPMSDSDSDDDDAPKRVHFGETNGGNVPEPSAFSAPPPPPPDAPVAPEVPTQQGVPQAPQHYSPPQPPVQPAPQVQAPEQTAKWEGSDSDDSIGP